MLSILLHRRSEEVAAILSVLIAELRATPIVTFSHISILRRYIAAKYPDLPLPQSTAILADAVNKIVEKKIAVIGEAHRTLIKSNLFRMIARRRYFQINAGDILEASLPLEWSDEFFQTELCQWVNLTLRKAVPVDKLAGLLQKLFSSYRQKSGRDLETLAGEIDGRGVNTSSRVSVRSKARAVQSERNRAVGGRAADKGAAIAGRGGAPDAGEIFTPVAELRPEKMLPQEKANAWAVWESIEPAAPQFFEIPEPEKAVSRDTDENLYRELAWHEPDVENSAAEQGRWFKPGKIIMVGAAAAVITIMLMFSFLGAILSNRAMMVSGVAVAPGTERHATLSQLADEIGSLEKGFDAYQEATGRDAALVEQVKQNAATTASTVGAGGAADDQVFVATVSAKTASRDVSDEWAGNDIKASANDAYLMKATAYDLSVGSCGKTPDDPLYGVTRSGAKAQFGRTIAVDPQVIPLGSKVKLTFPDHYSYLNGIYFAEDTGSAIKGNHIDLFMGEDLPGEKFVYDDAMKFGIQQVKLQILR